MTLTQDLLGQNWLVCGTRKKSHLSTYKNTVFNELNKIYESVPIKPFAIIHGACKDSADEYAEEWAVIKGLAIKSYPSVRGNYLGRNIEMVKRADFMIAFWDLYSYGTAHTIAHAAMKGIPIVVIRI